MKEPKPEKRIKQISEPSEALELLRRERKKMKELQLTPEEREELKTLILESKELEAKGELETAAEKLKQVLKRMKEIRGKLEKEKGTEKLEKLFELKKQYQEQVKALLETQVIEILPESSKKAGKEVLGVYDINGKECPIPSYEEILKRMEAKAEMLERKREQGFTELLLVPIGTPLSFLIDRTRDLIVKKHKEGKLKGTDGEKLELDESQPVDVADEYKDADVSGDLVYYPEKFDKANHSGKTKQELLADWPASRSSESVGWEIMFVEDLPDLPAENEGQEVGGRKQLEANQSPEQYLAKIQTDPQYANEQFITPEAQLAYFMQYLQKNNRVIDDWDGNGKSCWNVGAYFKSGRVPFGYWNRNNRQFFLYWNRPASRYGNLGVRSSVGV